MNPAEVAVCEVQRQRMDVVVDLLAERIGEGDKPPHAHDQVVPLYMAGGCVLPAGIAGVLALACAISLGPDVAVLLLR